MTNNDILRSVRYMLNLSDAKMVEIFALAQCDVPLADIQAWLKKMTMLRSAPAPMC